MDQVHILRLHEQAQNMQGIPSFSQAYTYNSQGYCILLQYLQCLHQVFLL